MSLRDSASGGQHPSAARLSLPKSDQAASSGPRRGSDQTGDAGSAPVPHAWFWGLVAAGVGLDLLTKHLAFALAGDSVVRHILSDGRPARWGPTVIPGFLYVTPSRNPGMAWSVGGRIPWPLLALVTAAIAGYVGYYRHKAVVHAGRHLFDLSLGLVLMGAVGNLVDRVFTVRHEVLDFIDVWFGSWSYPVFNLADVFIVAGVIGYVWWGWRMEGPALPAADAG